MEFLSSGDPETILQTETAIERVRGRWDTRGNGWWAMIELATGHVIGAACAQNVASQDRAEIKIGWRLAIAMTGRGYAT